MNKWSACKLMSVVNLTDGLIGTYAAVWMSVVWMPHLGLATVSGREVVGAAMAILTGTLLAYSYKKGVSMKVVILTTVICMLTSFVVYIDHRLAAVTAIMAGQIQVVCMMSFVSRLSVKNIPTCERVKYDTIQVTSSRIGKCIGAVLAYLFPLSFPMEENYMIASVGIRSAMILYFVLVKMKILKY